MNCTKLTNRGLLFSAMRTMRPRWWGYREAVRAIRRRETTKP